MKIEAIKYNVYKKFRDPFKAQLHVEKLKEKRPDQEFTLLVNTKAYSKQYSVARITRVAVDLPTEDELGLGSVPEYPREAARSTQAWNDYQHEMAKRRSIIDAARLPALQELTGF